jgi:hypothetical protein
MGLDITAYRQLTPAPNAQVDEDGNPVEWDKFVAIRAQMIAWTEENWHGRTAPLQAGIYTAAQQDGFRAGSYGGFNAWRNWLAQRAGYTSARAVWDDVTSGPFVELINFADNEGYIGAAVAAKLAKDFAEHQEAIIGADPHGYDAEKYLLWRAAFEMAADGGCVEFH